MTTSERHEVLLGGGQIDEIRLVKVTVLGGFEKHKPIYTLEARDGFDALGGDRWCDLTETNRLVDVEFVASLAKAVEDLRRHGHAHGEEPKPAPKADTFTPGDTSRVAWDLANTEARDLNLCEQLEVCPTCHLRPTIPVAPEKYVLSISVRPDAVLSCHVGLESCEWVRKDAQHVIVGDHVNLYTYCVRGGAEAGTEASFVVEEVEQGAGPFGRVVLHLRPSEPSTHWPEHRPSADSSKLQAAKAEKAKP